MAPFARNRRIPGGASLLIPSPKRVAPSGAEVCPKKVVPRGGAVTNGYVYATLDQKNSLGGTPGSQDFKLPLDNESQSNSFTAPLLVLGSGDYLRVHNRSQSTHSFSVTVTGYLTAQPEKLRL